MGTRRGYWNIEIYVDKGEDWCVGMVMVNRKIECRNE